MLVQLKARFWALIMPVLIGLFVIIYIAMGLVYLQQQREKSDLEYQIDQVELIVSRPVGLSAESQEKYDLAREALPPELSEIELEQKKREIIVAVLDLAESKGFNVSPSSSDIPTPPTPGGVTTEIIGQSNYQSLPFTMVIEGDETTVMSFLSALTTMSDLQTLVLDSLTVTRGEFETKIYIEFNVYVARMS